MQVIIVVPVHNELAVLPHFLEQLISVMGNTDVDWEAIFVEDGSTDGTWDVVREAARSDERIRALRLSRNFGHQAALTAGIWAAEGDAVITMDGDLQHPPETIPLLLAKAAEGYDVVHAVRSETDSSGWFKMHSARAFYWTFNRLARLDLPSGAAEFRYMSRDVVRALMSMPERHRFVRGMTRWVGYRQTMVEYDQAPRAAGKSKYTVTAMLRLAVDAILSFSTVPLKLVSVLGLVVSLLGAVYGMVVISERLFGQIPVQGFTALTVVILVLGGVQLISIGVIGQYLGRVYDEGKARPLFLVWEDTRKPPAMKPEETRDE